MSRNKISDSVIFVSLFKEVYNKCFGQSLEKVPSESNFRHLSDEIEEKTGLIIGWKSLKNYASFVMHETEKQVYPSAATLDTLSRYLFDAPVINEIQRKENNNSYSYWFRYREQYLEKHLKPKSYAKSLWKNRVIITSLVLIVMISFLLYQTAKHPEIEEYFQAADVNNLLERGWHLLARNEQYWNRRSDIPEHLTLYTLRGDSWPTKEETPRIQNLVYRKSLKNNFSAEVHFSNFVPHENWQQSGLLLMEDTLYKGKYIRISFAYNDYYGGIKQPGEIYIQVVASKGRNFSNLEEVVHHPIFRLDSTFDKNVVDNNLKYSALMIEKKGNTCRFLYAASPFDNFSFQEIGNYNLTMEPNYIGIFALRGFVESTSVIPVSVRYFRQESLSKR